MESCTSKNTSDEFVEDDEFVYSGKRDSAGEPHGRGTLTFLSGDSFHGHFYHGVKQGKGTFNFADGSSLSGVYADDSLEGVGVYRYADGRRLEAAYVAGELSGPAEEYSGDGMLLFHGAYTENTRSGWCWLYEEDGGCVVGEVSADGSMTGDNIAYVYPDSYHAVLGTFDDGQLVQGKTVKLTPCKRFSTPHFEEDEQALTYRFDESTECVISADPLLVDLYEQSRVYVKESCIPGANEGLFSKIDEDADKVMSFYNGVRLTHEQVDARDWALNGNTISLDEDCVIDVPARYVHTRHYAASLGHKANHSFTPNCKYDVFEHPRFGAIKCIRTICSVKKDEELTVFYGYEHQGEGAGDTEAPQWYLQQKLAHETATK